MDYIELNIPVADAAQAEIVVAELAELPFESFATEGGLLKAYIPQDRLIDCKEQADELMQRCGIRGARYVQIESQNWNQLWESNFQPVDIDGRVLVRAPFHPAGNGCGMEIVIMPKMSFGTGHHATTCLMVRAILDLAPLDGRRVLDMGCGTGILAIAAAKCGAAAVDAVDIDEWAAENCRENVRDNATADRTEVLQGDISAVAGRRYDLILANINRNILLHDMAAYARLLDSGGHLIVSGFLDSDICALRQGASACGLHPAAEYHRDGWSALVFKQPVS